MANSCELLSVFLIEVVAIGGKGRGIVVSRDTKVEQTIL